MLKSSKILWMLISLLIVSLIKNWLLCVPLTANINVVYYSLAVHQRAAELGAMLGKFHTVMAHFKTGHADRDSIRANREIIFIFELYAPAIIEVNKGHNA